MNKTIVLTNVETLFSRGVYISLAVIPRKGFGGTGSITLLRRLTESSVTERLMNVTDTSWNSRKSDVPREIGWKDGEGRV